MERRRPLDEWRDVLAAADTRTLPGVLRELEADPRAGARELARAYRAREARRIAEIDRLDRLMDRQRALHDAGVAVVAGCDEVGRGALAGPVTAAAVVLAVGRLPVGLDDSKKLAPPVRDRVAAEIRTLAVACCVAHASPSEIDTLGIADATFLAMRRALDGLGTAVDHVLVDGNCERVGRPATPVIGGDSSEACIAAASVLAKVERDALMFALATTHPGYGFDVNKGYGTSEHIEAITTLGPSPLHRMSFAPMSSGGRLFTVEG